MREIKAEWRAGLRGYLMCGPNATDVTILDIFLDIKCQIGERNCEMLYTPHWIQINPGSAPFLLDKKGERDMDSSTHFTIKTILQALWQQAYLTVFVRRKNNSRIKFIIRDVIIIVLRNCIGELLPGNNGTGTKAFKKVFSGTKPQSYLLEVTEAVYPLPTYCKCRMMSMSSPPTPLLIPSQGGSCEQINT